MENINVTHIQSLDISGLSNIRVTTSGRSMTLAALPSDKSNYEKGMRRAMQKIAASCGRVFGADVGYEDLPDLVESIVRSKKESAKPKPTKFVKVEESIFDLKAEFERGELYFFRFGKYEKCDTWKGLCHILAEGSAYRQVEVDWRDEVSLMVKKMGISYSSNGIGHLMGISWDGDDEFIAICHKVAELTDKPE